jgi:outer membrane protein assembly factor BamB
MRTLTHAALLSVATVSLFAASSPDPRAGVDWPSFRGINGAGVADSAPTPTTWDVPKGSGVAWTTALDGLGHSSPVIWGNQLCVTTAKSDTGDASMKLGLYGDIASVTDNTEHTWRLVCVDKRDGTPMFDTVIHKGVPIIKRHTKATHANSTLATDGTHIVAMLGSEGLFAFDMKGTLKWKKDFGVLDSGFFMAPTAQWGFASSPVIHQGRVIIQADVQKNSFVGAFDLATGKELWRTARQDVPTWSTPAIHQVGGKTQIIVNGWRHTGAYDFETGAEIWKLKSVGGDIPVPVPVFGGGMVYLTSAHGAGGAPVYAIKETATGDISLAAAETSNAHIAWSYPRDGAYMMSPVLYQGLLYVSKNNGVFNVFDAATGERIYQQRLGDGTTGFTASLVAADGKIYFSSEDGDVYVVKAGRTFELLAKNPLGDYAMATPAISEGRLYFRTGKSIVAIR